MAIHPVSSLENHNPCIVGHWGHIHQQQNQYEAELRIDPVDGTWKLTALDLISEQRL